MFVSGIVNVDVATSCAMLSCAVTGVVILSCRGFCNTSVSGFDGDGLGFSIMYLQSIDSAKSSGGTVYNEIATATTTSSRECTG